MIDTVNGLVNNIAEKVSAKLTDTPPIFGNSIRNVSAIAVNIEKTISKT
jgi:hypothetical protein